MNEFFKNNPIAFRHCIRFEILQGNPIEQAYSNICEILGEEVIDYKKFRIRFNHFSKKKFNDKEQENPCTKYIRNDKYALRVCILYESLKYQKDKSSVPIFEVFVSFCKVIGVENVLKYPEFEFWFYRFLNEEFDLNYERDEEKKIYELMDMPIDVMKNVVEYLDIFDRANLVQTSRSLQTFFKDQKLFHHTLKLRVLNSTAKVSFYESVNIHYIKNDAACRKIIENREKLVRGVDYWKQALLDSKKVLKNPKLHLDNLAIELHVDKGDVFDDLENALKLNHHLNVKKLSLVNYKLERISNILRTLKPGYLTDIYIDSYHPKVDSMNTVFEMEQWKQAKCFTMTMAKFIWSLHHLFHFKEFHVWLWELSEENIREMKEIPFKSPHFEKCSFFISDGIDRSIIEQEFGNAFREEPCIYHYPIPNSTDYFEIKAEGYFFGVTRKKN